MKLKVLSGLHAGALVELEGPVVLIGRDSQCDVIFTDEEIDALHLMLSIEAGLVRVRVFNEGSAQLNGRPVSREAIWQPGGVLDLHGVQFELVADAVELEETEEASEWAATEIAPSPLPLDTQSQPGQRGGRGGSQRGRFWRLGSTPAHKGWAARTLAGVACLCGAVMVLGVTFREISAHPTAAPYSNWDASTLTAQLRTDEFKKLKTSTDAAGVLVLSGHVADDRVMEALRTQLAEPLRHGRVRLRVETLTDYAQTLIQQIDDPGVKARFASTDRLVLWGEATRPATESKIIRLEQEFGSNFEIDSRISYEKSAKASSGPVPKEVPIQIAHVSGGSEPSIVTQAGQQYFQGAKLADGTEVVSITTEKVVLRYGDKVVEYQFE
ncbi:MAG: FHA domain-containing protein [Rhizobacter sp.]